VVERDIPYAEGPRHQLDLYRPEAAGRRPLILFFHGGFWQMGGKDSLENQVLASGLASRGAVVLAANYRLYPETRFPGFLEDAAAAVAWARRNAERLGAAPEGIFVAGHSAGAYIAMMLALDGQWLAGQGLRPRDLAGAIGIAGPYLGDFPRHWTVRGVFAGQPDLAALLPGSFATATAPPLLLLGGGMDAVVEARHLQGLAERVAGAGGRVEAHVYPGVGHLGILMSLPWLPGTAPVAEDITRFALHLGWPQVASRRPGILQAATGP
jgi:acetyl esterase/lipase